jgi:hypothetical protein
MDCGSFLADPSPFKQFRTVSRLFQVVYACCQSHIRVNVLHCFCIHNLSKFSRNLSRCEGRKGGVIVCTLIPEAKERELSRR